MPLGQSLELEGPNFGRILQCAGLGESLYLPPEVASEAENQIDCPRNFSSNFFKCTDKSYRITKLSPCFALTGCAKKSSDFN